MESKTRPTGEEELRKIVQHYYGFFDSDMVDDSSTRFFTINEVLDLLSQSKKELLERIKAEATNRATDIEKHREPICREYFTEIARSRLLEEILNRELDSLTNQTVL